MKSIRTPSTFVWCRTSLHTHTPASLYETFPPAEARRILQRVEFHYTPKHGSWLNMAEIEIAILERNALSRRVASEDALRGPRVGGRNRAQREAPRHRLAVHLA